MGSMNGCQRHHRLSRITSLAVLLCTFFCVDQTWAAAGETKLVSRGNVALESVPTGIAVTDITTGAERHVSDDGDLIVFSSTSRLTGYAQLEEDNEARSQIFLHQRSTGRTHLISQTADGFAGNNNSREATMSADGRYIVYGTGASNLTGIPFSNGFNYRLLVLDRQTGETEIVPRLHSEIYYNSPQISADGNLVVYAGRSDESIRKPNVYAYNRATQTTIRVSRSLTGDFPNQPSTNASLSANGRFVAYESAADNIVTNDTNVRSDIFVFDLQSSQTQRISVDQWGFHGILDSYAPSINGDGRFVAFHTKARNLVRDDSNDAFDVIVYDRQTGIPVRVSVATGGGQANGDSTYPSISEDGRYVSFQSIASNLTAADTNSREDIYLHDRVAGETTLISRSAVGEVAAQASELVGISATGRFTSFLSTAKNLVNGDNSDRVKLFVHDREVGTNLAAGIYSNDISLPSDIPGEMASRGAAISADGSVIVFESRSENFVTANPELDTAGLYALDTLNNRIEFITDLLPRFSSMGYSAQISADGQLIAMNATETRPTPLGDNEIHLFNRSDSTTKVMNRLANGTVMDRCNVKSISANGGFVGMSCDQDLLPGDSNGTSDAMVTNTATGEIEIVSINSNGQQADDYSAQPYLSADGRFALFHSRANNLDARVNDSFFHLYVRDREAGTTELISLGVTGEVSNYSETLAPGNESNAAISADGRYVVFESEASNIVPDSGARVSQARIFLRDRLTNTTSLVCKGVNGEAANAACHFPSISADGSRISYQSSATNIVADDRNGAIRDIFVFDRSTGSTQIVSKSSQGLQTQLPARAAAISGDGRFVAFESFDTGLDAIDKWAVNDIFVHEISAEDSGETPSFSVSSLSVDENSGTARVVVTLNPVSTTSSSVKLATRAGSAIGGVDFYGTFVTLDFPPGTATQSVSISILNDSLSESDESFDVRLFRSTGDVVIGQTEATITIVDDDSGGGVPVYSDVPSGHFAYDEIQRFHASGIAGRCGQSPLRFCPDNYLRRDVMAQWLGRSKYGAAYPQPQATGQRYTDVPASYWSAGWLEQADRDRIYRGCGDFSTACPGQSMTRAQLAVFTVIARYGVDHVLPPATGLFSDIAPSHWAARHVEQLVRDGVVVEGCAGAANRFCASAVATRSVAAIWIVRAFGL